MDDIKGFQKKILGWFQKYGRDFPWRKNNISDYEFIISEIFLQRTKAETVKEYYPEFIKKYPSWNELSKANLKDLHDLIKPLGLWRRRSIVLRELSIEMINRKGVLPRDPDELEELPGIGQYIANAILSFRHGINKPLLDTNMARVIERHFGPRKKADIRYDPHLQYWANEIVQKTDPMEINWGILDLAATICTIKEPFCKLCPVNETCKYYQVNEK